MSSTKKEKKELGLNYKSLIIGLLVIIVGTYIVIFNYKSMEKYLYWSGYFLIENTLKNIKKRAGLVRFINILIFQIIMILIYILLEDDIPEIKRHDNFIDKLIASFYVSINLTAGAGAVDVPKKSYIKLIYSFHLVFIFLILLFDTGWEITRPDCHDLIKKNLASEKSCDRESEEDLIPLNIKKLKNIERMLGKILEKKIN